jgi:Domain of unknown function (DUF397)
LNTPAAPDCDQIRWRKSSYSNAGNACVEVGQVEAAYAVRDSKNPNADYLIFGTDAWRTFVGDVKAGRFDL